MATIYMHQTEFSECINIISAGPHHFHCNILPTPCISSCCSTPISASHYVTLDNMIPSLTALAHPHSCPSLSFTCPSLPTNLSSQFAHRLSSHPHTSLIFIPLAPPFPILAAFLLTPHSPLPHLKL